MNLKGRPRKEGSKNIKYQIRMSAEDLQKLEEASVKLGISKADVIREGIDIEYLKAKYKE